jgi:DNA gyrase subunit A
MATNIPPHNLGEVVDAAVALIGDRNLTTTNLMKFIQGPDFPTGGQLLNSKPELREIYDAGQGAIRVRGEYKLEEKKRGGTDLVITSIPWAMTKSSLVEKIAEVIISRKLPYLVDIRDESTDDVRIVLEIKKDADPDLVMAYLYKNTPLQSNFHVNMTCLVPPGFLSDDDGRALPANAPPQPRRLGIKDMLGYFLDFRIGVTQRRVRGADGGQIRSPGIREVRRDDHAAVLKVWAKRYRDLGRTRTQVVCRLHAVLRAGPRRRRQGDHRRAGRADPRIGRAAGRGCGSPLRARRGLHR